MHRCYNEEIDYELEDLGNDAWLTGCPMCGDQCWVHVSAEQKKKIDMELDKDHEAQ